MNKTDKTPDYKFNLLEDKWRDTWATNGHFQVNDNAKKKFYYLNMFPYPSGQMHVGHGRNYLIGDAYHRYLTMQGHSVLNPMGFDSFGLPAENAAISNGIAPQEWTETNIQSFKEQFKQWGVEFDWDREIRTSDPSYYKWNQWLFIQMYKLGLAYKKGAEVNWCEGCQTVLANEQVVDGGCERCGTSVKQQMREQWFFKITDYVDELLDGLDTLPNWPKQVKTMQRNWIGKSTGASILFELVNSELELEVFTTRADTLYGATFMVVAPEHPLLSQFVTSDQKEAVETYINQVKGLSNIDRQKRDREKTGVFTGCYAINPVNNQKLPIYTADYVLRDYGSGAVMAVPAHDQRDFEFAKAFDLPIKQVISPAPGLNEELIEAWTGDGLLINSGECSGLPAGDVAISKIINLLEETGAGSQTVNYRLRDWLVSRQRYWGTPIPIIYCDSCGTVPVPDSDLPIELPVVENLGKKGLAEIPSFYETTCPQCGASAHRETDTLDTFVDSSWYYLRYISPSDDEKIFDSELVNKWLPVDQYVGGIEHAILHLLYSRFITRVFRDLGLVDFSEPFDNLYTQGMIIHRCFKCKDHGWLDPKSVDTNHLCPHCGSKLHTEIAKMSKSKKNVISPVEIIEEYGADAQRLYTLSMPPDKEAEWTDEGIKGAYRYLHRFWNLIHKNIDLCAAAETGDDVINTAPNDRESKQLWTKWHETMQTMAADVPKFRFHKIVSAIRELTNDLQKYLDSAQQVKACLVGEICKTLTQCLSIICPFIGEEMWQRIGYADSVLNYSWPESKVTDLQKDEVDIAVQINGKLKTVLKVATEIGTDSDKLENFVRSHPEVTSRLNKQSVDRAVTVPGRLVNLVLG